MMTLRLGHQGMPRNEWHCGVRLRREGVCGGRRDSHQIRCFHRGAFFFSGTLSGARMRCRNGGQLAA
eukprot:366076-Chlamydomonas_euryale.AAC.4